MGIDITSLDAILKSLSYVSNKSTALTLGRQQIHLPTHYACQMFQLYNYPQFINKCFQFDYSETFFKQAGFYSVDCMDASSYEGASIIHNLNTPLTPEHKKYSYIYDGGTTEHVFNVAQVYENIINLLEVGGVFCTVVPNNNLSGHGLYQFSPDFFLTVFAPAYGMEIRELWIGRVDDLRSQWKNVNSLLGFRNLEKFEDTKMVYCICIAQRVSDKRKSLLEHPPNQFSYESVEWKKE